MKDSIKPEDSYRTSRRSLKNGFSPVGRVYGISQSNEAVPGTGALSRLTQRKDG